MSKNSILLIDDEKLNLLLLHAILSDDYTLYMARSGEEGLERANELKPDLILLDVVMPGIDGYEVLVTLRKSEKTKDIPVIFITGLSGSDYEKKGLLLGAEDYIGKPLNETIVKLRVRNQIRIVNQMRIIEKLSTRDELTDLPNRRSFNQQLDMEWRRAVRDALPLSLLMIDADNFKQYNDKFGHRQGDAALRTVAGVIRETLKRSGDFAARWGGEEFVVLLPSTEREGALKIAEKIRQNVENTKIESENSGARKITVSIGFDTRVPTMTDETDCLFSSADDALYAAKASGRNKTCQFGETKVMI